MKIELVAGVNGMVGHRGTLGDGAVCQCELAIWVFRKEEWLEDLGEDRGFQQLSAASGLWQEQLSNAIWRR